MLAHALWTMSLPIGPDLPFCSEVALKRCCVQDMRLAWEEPFGPVVPVVRVKSVEEAIDHCNANNLALQGCVFSRDIDQGELSGAWLHLLIVLVVTPKLRCMCPAAVAQCMSPRACRCAQRELASNFRSDSVMWCLRCMGC